MEDFVNKVREIYLPKRYQKHYANKIPHGHLLKKKYAARNPLYKMPKSTNERQVKLRKPMVKRKKPKNYKTNPVGDYFRQNEQPTSEAPDLFSNIR